MSNKVVYVSVRVIVKEGANINDVVSDCDYNFDHPDIIDTEIVSYDDHCYA